VAWRVREAEGAWLDAHKLLPIGFQKPKRGATDAERAQEAGIGPPPRAQNEILSRVQESLSEPMEW